MSFVASSGVETWLSLLGAGSVGGFLSDWLLKRGEGRALRGDVRAALGELRERVWLDGNAPVEPQWDELLGSLRAFQAKSFVARVPRPVSELVTRVVVSAWRYQVDRLDTVGVDAEGGPGMRHDAAELVTDVLQLAVENLHQPIRRRLFAASSCHRLVSRVESLDDEQWQRAWKTTAKSTLY